MKKALIIGILTTGFTAAAAQTLMPAGKQKMEQFRDAKTDVIVTQIGVQPEKQGEFRDLYQQYDKSQSSIAQEFNDGLDPREMTDDQAKEKIYKGFDISQKLLNNKKNYTEKFLQVITPRQLYHMYQTEKRMGRKVMERSVPRNDTGGRR
ncbi:MAG: hypothetical protein EAS48_01550 [Chryseobacterium sp.]|nr:MAG: hypothetical protein EAS48_01550 [Chryseobacterium sp.]